MKRTIIAVALVSVTVSLMGCTKQPQTLSATTQPSSQPSVATQSVAPDKSVATAEPVAMAKSEADAERPIYQWAAMVAVGDDPERVNTALKLVHYPPLDCLSLLNSRGGRTCNTASDDGSLTANFDKGNRLFSLEDASKDPERTNYRGLKTALTLMLGAPRVDRKNGLAWLTWHQRDRSRVTLVLFDGICILSLKDRTEPEG
jgi:hypothetical protein